MPITLRTRPTCHYCGKRNGPSQNQSKFTCQYCQADNYLDEHGNITDVPSTSTVASPHQYAVPLTPAFDNVEGSLFCATCLKNQYMYNAALSEYLPDPDHPEYDAFEAAIPAFKKDLEIRYPTCCARCEPMVKAQLQQATYNARSDHVRRVLDRSRQRRNANTWGWRSLVVNAAGLGWLVSLGVQLVWHALGSQAYGPASIPVTNLVQCFKSWPVPIKCPEMLEGLVGPSIMLGTICIWWNPKWQHKLEGREGRLVGLDKFYKVQGLLLALRFVLWTLAKDVPYLDRFKSVIHTVSMVLVVMVATWSRLSIIKIYMPQIVDWSQDPAPLLDRRQYVPPDSLQEISLPNSQQAIPVNIFDTSTPRGLQPWRPPTPPVNEDAMEWDPTPITFSPNLKKVNYKSSEPTPFRGTLAAFPKSNVYGIKREALVEQPKAIGLPAGMFDKSHGKMLDDKGKSRLESTGLAQPKFFPNLNNADTGLENIFDKVFSLKEESQVPSKNAQTTASDLGRTSNDTNISLELQSIVEQKNINVRKLCDGVTIFGFILYTLLFMTERFLDLTSLQINFTKHMSTFLSALHAWDILSKLALSQVDPRKNRDAAEVIELSSQNLMFYTLSRQRPEEQSLLLPLWSKLVTASLILALGRRLYLICISDKSDIPVLESKAPIETIYNAVPPPVLASQPPPTTTKPRLVRKTSSDESMASTASIATTSTASGWKTPLKSHRDELREMKHSSGSSSYGLGGLSLKNDHDFGIGTNVAGSRTTRTPARNRQQGW